MTARELLDSKGTSTINVIKLMEEYAQIKFLEIENWLMVNTDLDVKKIVDLKVKFNKPKI